MTDEIKEAINLLRYNGYVVKKWTDAMEQDANECEEMEEKCLAKDCFDYSCSVCLIQ